MRQKHIPGWILLLAILLAGLLAWIGGPMILDFFTFLRPALPKSTRPSPLHPVISGSFTQPWCVDDYITKDQWQAEFEKMTSAGIPLWIYQWTGDSADKTTIYPTQLPGYRQSSSFDQVEQALVVAQEYHSQVFMGLVFNDQWWQKEGTDRNWLMNEAEAMNRVADELYHNYYPRYPGTFAGWYINWEMDNVAGYNYQPAQKRNMIEALETVSGHLKELNASLPTSIAPFFNASLGVGPKSWKYFWYDVMRQTSLDILMLQDGVGVNHATVDQLPVWFQEVCQGVHAAGKQCWSDLENFTQRGSQFEPAPPERITAQLSAVAPYVDRVVTFSFIAYMSPVYGVDPAYLNAYLDYLARLP